MTRCEILFATIVGILLALAFALDASTAHADSPPSDLVPSFMHAGLCNRFEFIQSVLAAEGLQQPPAAQLEMARVLVTKGDESGDPCFRDRHWLSSWGAATDFIADPIKYANGRIAFLKFFMFNEYLTPAQREPLALAAHLALTENPRIPRDHFDSWDSWLAPYWFSPRSCRTVFAWRTISYPSGTIEYIPIRYIVIGQVRVC